MWTFVLTDRAFVPQGEIIDAYDRRVALPLNKLDTLSLKVRLDNPLADRMVTTEGYIKAYRNKILRYIGPIISAEEVASNAEASVAVNSVGAGWVLQKRLVGKSATGRRFTSAIDRAAIVSTLLGELNAEDETGIVAGSMSSASSVTYTAGPYRPMTEVITELGASFDGYDWRIFPVENWLDGILLGTNIGRLEAYPVMGTQRPEAIFEWGEGRNNIASYRRSVSRDTQANKVYHSTSAGPDAPGTPTISAIDATSITDWGLLEDLAQADLVDATLRQKLVDEHVLVRKNPRQVINFEPHIDPANLGLLPKFGVDYNVGDQIIARAKYAGRERFNGWFRVWGVEFNLDNHGVERATLTLAEE